MTAMESLTKAYVEITEQPMGKNLRFRYISEGRTAGSIQGEHSTPEHRTFPSIKIHNYSGPAFAFVSCVTTDKPPRLHPHHLVGTNCVTGVCKVRINACSDHVPFANIGIQCCTRKDVARNIEERRQMNIDPFRNGHIVNVDTIDLTTVCLCFQVYADVNGNLIPLAPVVSNPIVDKKVCSELSIYRLSRISGSVRGGDEVFLCCSKVKKEDIKVILSHQLDNGETWEKEGSFSSTDVHKQYVVVFKTPSYHEIAITKPVEVSLYLMRPSDGAVGEAKAFTYFPENPDPFGIKAKRKRLEQSNPSYYVPEVKPTSNKPFGFPMMTNAHMKPFQPPLNVTSNDGSQMWNIPGLSSNMWHGLKPVKEEVQFGQPQAGMNLPVRHSMATAASSLHTMPHIPTTVGTAQRAPSQMIPSSSSFPFQMSSASTLEALMNRTGPQMVKPSTMTNAASSVSSSLRSVNNQVPNLPMTNAPASNHLSQAGASDLLPRPNPDFVDGSIGDSAMLSQLPDLTDDWLGSVLPPDVQKFVLDGFTELDEQALKSLQELSGLEDFRLENLEDFM